MIQFTTAELNRIVARLYDLEDNLARKHTPIRLLSEVRAITDALQERIPVNEQTSIR
jgi:hypothetical protein